VDRAVCTSLLALGVMVLLNRRQAVRQHLGQYWPIVLFIVYCLISLTWSDFPDVAFKRLIREVGNLIMVLVVWTDQRPFTALIQIIARTTYTLIPLSILFAKYYPQFGRVYGYWIGETMYTGVTEDKNSLGAICLLLGVASVWHLLHLFSSGRCFIHGKRILVHVIVLMMAVYLLVEADSVTSLSCAALATCVLFALRWRVFSRRHIMVHFLVVLSVCIPMLVAFFDVSPDTLQAMGRNSTLTDRTLIWAWVSKLVPNQWVGAGYSSFWLGHRLDVMIANVTHTWVPNQAHNGYLEVFANLGWVGVGLLGLVILWGYLRIIRSWRHKSPGSDLMLAYFLIGVISNISEASFFRNLVPVWLFFMIAITMPPINQERSFEGLISSPERIGRVTRVVEQDTFEAIRRRGRFSRRELWRPA
jgi:exopolysaccharide production protein ExoQ